MGPSWHCRHSQDKHLKEWNEQASRFARGAWQTSDLWVRSEAQKELMASTVTRGVMDDMCFAFVGINLLMNGLNWLLTVINLLLLLK